MNAALVTMIILGCNHGESDCNFIREIDTRFETEAACQRQADDEMILTRQTGYPVVMVVCKKDEEWLSAESTPTGEYEVAEAPHVVMAPEFAEDKQDKKGGKIRKIAHRITDAARNFGSAVVGGFRFVFTGDTRPASDPIELGRKS
ncbi:MAG: hypothetical protein ACR2O0_00625 [Rhizobiaceae bacterium]